MNFGVGGWVRLHGEKLAEGHTLGTLWTCLVELESLESPDNGPFSIDLFPEAPVSDAEV